MLLLYSNNKLPLLIILSDSPSWGRRPAPTWTTSHRGADGEEVQGHHRRVPAHQRPQGTPQEPAAPQQVEPQNNMEN